MAALAGLFNEKGYHVTGSDQASYPPMSDFLAKLGIPVIEGYRAENLKPGPDLVVVGNVIRKDNPEAIALMESGIPYLTMPEAINRFFASEALQVVVSGTHGKTTVSSMIAWILADNGLDPGFMIGGIPLNFQRSFRQGSGKIFIIEGDEYDTAFYEKTPKLIHYKPFLGALTSCEFDHGDIYNNVDEIKEHFKTFAHMIPKKGALIAFGQDQHVSGIATEIANSQVYGLERSLEWAALPTKETSDGLSFELYHKGKIVSKGRIQQVGAHNLANGVAAIAVTNFLGVQPSAAIKSLAGFKGVARRQEHLAEVCGALIIDDFAHHPTAVRETILGVSSRYPDRRVIAIFEPRTNTSRRAFFQREYAEALSHAKAVFIKSPDHIGDIPEVERFSVKKLSADLEERGIVSRVFNTIDEMVEYLCIFLRPGDIALSMSNGAFGGLNQKLIKALHIREQPRSDQ